MGKSKHVLIVSTLMSVLSLSACVKEETKYIEKQAPTNMLESFGDAKNSKDKSCAKANCITIKKESLGKVYLMISSGITSGKTPQWIDSKPQIVSFQKSGDRIALLSENYKSIYEEINTQDLVQSFLITSETDDEITFNWGEGLKSFVYETSYDTDDTRDQNSEEGNEDLASVNILPVADSFVTKLKVTEDAIEINQLSKISSSKIIVGNPKALENKSLEDTVNMNIQLRPYDLSSEFKKKEADKSRRVGFFVTRTNRKGYSAGENIYISKWDTSEAKGPIRVLVSKAVPEEYVSSVKEGALYWNKVFKREVLKVETGIAIDEKPQHRSIMIRWIPWLDAGHAYAMPQSDPLTGEILRAQVFLTSVFTKVGAADSISFNKNKPILAGHEIACDHSPANLALEKLMAEAPVDKRLLLAQDGVRSTVAHEVGHALGLRHNFAASYSSKVKTADIAEAVKTYYSNSEHPGLETATSIMDYVSGVDNILLSARLKHSALPYDKMAMDWAYSDNDANLSEQISLYCTDDDIAKAAGLKLEIYGCERFDAGNNPLERRIQDILNEQDNLVNTLMAAILARYTDKDNSGYKLMKAVIQQLMPFASLMTNADPASKILMQKEMGSQRSSSKVAYDMLVSIQALKNGEAYLANYGQDDVLNQAIKKDLAAIGGYGKVMSTLLLTPNKELRLNWLADQLQDLEKNSYYSAGKTLGGIEYNLSDAEVQMIKTFFTFVAEANKSKLLTVVESIVPFKSKTVSLQGTNVDLSQKLKYGLAQASDLTLLREVYLQILSSQNGVIETFVGDGLVTKVTLPKATVDSQDRVTYAGLLSSENIGLTNVEAVTEARTLQKKKIEVVLKEIDIKINFDLITDHTTFLTELQTARKVSYEAYKWLREELAVYKALTDLR